MKTFVSDISGKHLPVEECIAGSAVRESVMDVIREEHPDFDTTKHLSVRELNAYREKYISRYLEQEVGDMGKLEEKVLESIKDKTVISDADDNTPPTLGEKIADRVASFGGSWKFIIIFSCFIVLWIGMNAFLLTNRDVDPYPFILLNLLLSCLAALQAPVIMMSQNRQADKDRAHARNDYMVNLKSELEVRGLHEKIDHMMLYQQQELIEIQKIQIEMLNDIVRRLEHSRRAVVELEHKLEREVVAMDR